MFKRVAVHLDDDRACERRVRAALQLAAEHRAELVGIYATHLPPQYVYDDSIVPDAVYAALQRRLADEKEAARNSFRKIVQHSGVVAHWRAPEGLPDEMLSLHARYCDVLVLSQADDSDPDGFVSPYFSESIIMSAGRPVLMIPSAGREQAIGVRVLFCWNQGRESARALADAAPILRRAQELIVLTVESPRQGIQLRNTDRDDLRAYCLAQGYPLAREITRDAGGINIGETILNCADEHDSDLIVMGAYGHHRLRAWFMGGASKAVLSAMTVPVMLSH